MKTLYDACTPRSSVFDLTKTEDVLNLTDLLDGNVDPAHFFEETFVTEGMQTLFDIAFSRFLNQGQTGVVKLTQSMGGGKTHNMLALGLLAKSPEYREKILADNDRYKDLGKVRVVGFSGRETDAEFGIWGAIAEQLGKKEQFAQYYAPLQPPGETAWKKLLEGDPLLILLDELPPYLENAKSKVVGNSDLSVVTSTALANLFTALGKGELSNVCLVISDLKAAYESGSELIRGSFGNLESEVNRSAVNIEPVGSGTDDIYNILKKRLFKKLPDQNEIKQVATAYKDELNKARQMNLTSTSADHIYSGILEAYPFHPSIRDLYARFKENLGFQQTRGLIRMMRQILAGLYVGDNCKAKSKYLINVFDFDLNDRAMLTTVTQIKPELSNAIAHDIASKGSAVAEQIDAQFQDALVSDVSKIILVASLANTPNALLGLNLKEIIGYLCEPGRDTAGLKKALDEFQERAWYLELDKEGKLFFKNVKNLVAVMHDLVGSYDNDAVKTTTLKDFLAEKFKPVVGDCYQDVLVFPPIDSIDLQVDRVTLVLFEPYAGGDLHPKLKSFYENTAYKNRVMFLSGSRDTMDRLYDAAKHLKAMEKILANMRDEKVPEDNQQFKQAEDIRIKKVTAVLSAAQQTFSTLYYPMIDGIRNSDFNMQFTDNNYNGEEQIRKLLEEKQKFINISSVDDTLRRKCEERLFTRQSMPWSEIKRRAAEEIKWQWMHPGTLDNLLADSLRIGRWREHGSEIDKGPFPLDPTSVSVSAKGFADEDENSEILRLQPLYGDTIYYEVGAPATTASMKVDDPNNFTTSELKMSFICEDSAGTHETGSPVEWMRDIKIRYKVTERADGKYMTLQTQPGVTIKYTTDGSDPKHSGGTYHDQFKIPSNTKYVRVIGEYEGSYYDAQSIEIKEDGVAIVIDKSQPLSLNKKWLTTETTETFDHLLLFSKHAASLKDVRLVMARKDEQGNDAGWIELTLSDKIAISVDQVETVINNLKSSFVATGTANIEIEINIVNFETGEKFLGFVYDKDLSLTDFKPGEIRQ